MTLLGLKLPINYDSQIKNYPWVLNENSQDKCHLGS